MRVLETFDLDLNFSRSTWSEIECIVSEISHPKKHISIILEKEKIVSIGANTHHTKQIAIKYGYEFGEYHSELDAVIKMNREDKTDGLTLINFRFNRFGEIRMARPCIKCMKWCKGYFDRILYSHEDITMMYELDIKSYTTDSHFVDSIPEFETFPIGSVFKKKITNMFSCGEKNGKSIKTKKIKSN